VGEDKVTLDEQHPPEPEVTLSSDILKDGINTARPNSATTESFFSREEELAKLTSAIENQERKHLVHVAITGMPGVGKTLLVHKFITDNVSKFHNVIWIQAETESEAISAFLNLAKHLNIISKNSAVKNNSTYLTCFLSNIYKMLNKTKTVIIFDNAFIDINKFLPPVGIKTNNVTIIVTSQYSEWQCNLHIPLQCFSPDVSEQFLVQNLENCSRENAQKLAQCFDHLPLALQNLVSYFEDTKKITTLDGHKFTVDYLMIQAVDESLRYKISGGSRYSHCPEDICKFTSTNLSTDRNGIMSMCDSAFKHISKLQYGELAIKLLKLMAYLIPDSIEVSLFFKLEGIKDKNDINKAILLLQNFSLVSSQESTIAISKVVQYIIRNIYNRETLLKEILTCFGNNLQKESRVQYIASIFRPHLMKIHNHVHVYNYSRLFKEFDVLFIAG
jgi:DNA polymerase III delta prime subunit